MVVVGGALQPLICGVSLGCFRRYPTLAHLVRSYPTLARSAHLVGSKFPRG